jgi:hypothetical protein
MVSDSETSVDHPTAVAFIQALAERDFAALEACLAPDVAFRALLPGGVVEVGSDKDAAGVLEHWFGVYDRYRLVGFETGYLGDMIRIGYRVEGHADDDWWEVEQQAYCEAVDDRFVRVNLVCSGVYDRDPPAWA